MVTKIFSATVLGIESVPVEVEASVANGLPNTIIVGLPDTVIQESKERIRSAIRHSGFEYPQARVAVNLAPADLPKVGTHFDLPIALAILKSAGLITGAFENRLFAGELALDGSLRPCRGVLSMALTARQLGFTGIFVPSSSSREASLVDGIQVFPVDNLAQLISHLSDREAISPLTEEIITTSSTGMADLRDIAGQQMAKRALEIAAAGGHNLRFIGPPGSGKTLLAGAMSGILPPLTKLEQLELTNLYSIAGLLNNGVVTQRPVRSPHHTMSAIALTGGGAVPKPGEVSLAHYGVLFLDELPEFNRNVLEVLRQPLEEGRVTIARVRQTYTFPSRFILITAQNPCPCGNFGQVNLQCRCLPHEVQRYNRKVSGPLLDRIDLHVSVPRLQYREVMQAQPAETSAEVRQRVIEARSRQFRRYGGTKLNSILNSRLIHRYCALDQETSRVLEMASDRFQLSGRSIHRILKVARTIADLDNQSAILQEHLLEALQYRLS